jgi:hypothetical protein
VRYYKRTDKKMKTLLEMARNGDIVVKRIGNYLVVQDKGSSIYDLRIMRSSGYATYISGGAHRVNIEGLATASHIADPNGTFYL